MLTHLSISNLAIIDHLEVSFGPGLNVITGETGAGKSIILGAVGLLMGRRASSEAVRQGSEEATVQGLFELPEQNPVAEVLTSHGLDEAGELILRRVVSAEGRSRAYVNGRLVNLSVLSEIGESLLSVSGQHESTRILKPGHQMDLVDEYAGLEGQKAELARAYQEHAALARKLKKISDVETDREKRLELLEYQLTELEQADLKAGEEEELAAEAARLRHAATLSQTSQGLYENLYGAEGSVAEVIGQAKGELDRIGKLDADLEPLAERLAEAGYLIEDLARELGDYAEQVVFDPQRQGEVEERLALIRRLVRKYLPGTEGDGAAALITLSSGLAEEMVELKDSDRRLAELERQTDQARQLMEEAAERLSWERRQCLNRLKAEVEEALSRLALEGARFEVELNPSAQPIGPNGSDKITFLLSTNPGEPLRPLAKVASGGELSRVTLALKSVLARGGEAETAIFDEVDAGIGGRVAEVVGRTLRRLSASGQVMCITHLAQIAAYGRSHHRVVKQSNRDRTVSTIVPLIQEDRVAELARMLGGVDLTGEALAHARQMLASAQG